MTDISVALHPLWMWAERYDVTFDLVVLFGLSTLLTRSILMTYGLLDVEDETLFLWRVLVLIGAPLAISGYIAGLWRDPPPVRQIVIRLGILAVATAIPAVLVAT